MCVVGQGGSLLPICRSAGIFHDDEPEGAEREEDRRPRAEDDADGAALHLAYGLVSLAWFHARVKHSDRFPVKYMCVASLFLQEEGSIGDDDQRLTAFFEEFSNALKVHSCFAGC